LIYIFNFNLSLLYSTFTMSDNPTAVDIITYIGVPLAVLGVMPIMYNTVVTLAAVSRIKRMLRHSRLTALTRSDVVNRVIEVELPRYAVTPLDRIVHKDEYWSLSRHPSEIPGGSWTTFNWKTNTIGLKTQRLEYADQLRQPQVEVLFDELVSYLMDLGAVPDQHGWRLLRSTGLWTPVGCSLLKSPDGQRNALTVAPLDDSDGHLSLAVNWSSNWTTRDHGSLPPYWVRLPAPPATKLAEEDEEENTDIEEGSAGTKVSVEQEHNQAGASTHKISMDTVQQEVESNAHEQITCQISVDGIVDAIPQKEGQHTSTRPDSLFVEHIRNRPGRTDGTWFASAITAYGTTSQTILWNYKIPDDILSFSRKDTVPCGVLVLLGVVGDAETPEWATTHNDSGSSLDLFVRRNREQQAAIQAEARMPPAQREQAARDRMRRENEQRLDDSKCYRWLHLSCLVI
jgi:hypothetical protein